MRKLSMPHTAFTDFRQNLAAHLNNVVQSRTPLLVTRQKGAAVVVISEEEFDRMQETIHLLRNPNNAARLLRSIAELDAGRGVEHDPTEQG